MFDQDPNEQANISGSDFAMMCKEMKQLREQRDELLGALEAFDNAAKESASIIGFAAKAFKLLKPARAAITKAKGEV